MERHWYAMYVMMHHEKRVAERLRAKRIECFVPIQEVVKQWSDRKKKLQQVVIPMMVFVRTSEKQRLEILQTESSARGFLMDRMTHRPAIIRDKEMEAFRFMLDFSDEAIHFCHEQFCPGERVRVLKGPLKGLEGKLVNADGKHELRVRIEQMGCAVVDIPPGYVEKITE